MAKAPMIIVDEHDQVIGQKVRGTLEPSDISRVAALWLTNSGGQVLMAKRHHTKAADPLKWAPAAAGTVEVGETYESNIYKEAEEEIGLTGVAFVQTHKFLVTGPLHKYFVQWFTATVDRHISGFTLQADEVAKIAWMDGAWLKQDIVTHPENYGTGAHTWPPFID